MYQHWLLKWINKTLQTLPSLPAPCKGGRPWCDDSWLTCILKKIQKCKPFPTHLIHFCRKKTIQKMEYKKMREKVVQPFRKKLNFICFVSTDFFSLSGSSPSPLQVAHCPLANARNRSRYRSSRSRHNPPRKFGEVWWVPHGGNITWRSQAKKEVTVPCTIFFFNRSQHHTKLIILWIYTSQVVDWSNWQILGPGPCAIVPQDDLNHLSAVFVRFGWEEMPVSQEDWKAVIGAKQQQQQQPNKNDMLFSSFSSTTCNPRYPRSRARHFAQGDETIFALEVFRICHLQLGHLYKPPLFGGLNR